MNDGQHRTYPGERADNNGQSVRREQTLKRQTQIVRDSGQMTEREQLRRDRERKEGR